MSLLAQGRVSTDKLLQAIPQMQRHEFIREGAAYNALAAAYGRIESAAPLAAAAEANATVFTQDNTAALVHMCLERHRRYRLAELAKVLVRIALCDLAALVDATQDTVMAEIHALTADGVLTAHIGEPGDAGPQFPDSTRADSVQSPIVTFGRAQTQLSGAEQADAIAHSLAEAQAATAGLSAVRAAVMQKPEVLSRVWLLHSGMPHGMYDDTEGRRATDAQTSLSRHVIASQHHATAIFRPRAGARRSRRCAARASARAALRARWD